MFLKDKTLGLLRRIRRDHIGETREPIDVGVIVDHLNVTSGDPGDYQLAIDEDPDHRECCHEVTLKDSATDLREAAEYMRASLCYGGSADPFYRTIAEWFDREAGQAERRIAPGFPGVADDLAVRAARAYLPGARAWLHQSGVDHPHPRDGGR